MIYWLYELLVSYDLPGLGMIPGITFRAGAAIITSLFIATVFGKKIIRILQKKQIGEVVRDLGLEGQLQKKGTPTMGGLIILTAGLFLMSSLGIGLLASTMANTQQEAMMTVMMFNLPMIFLSGFFFPIAAMPKFLQIVSYAIPLRYYLTIIRSLLIKGVGLAAIQSEVIALIIFGVVIMGAASLRFRKRLD